MKEKRMKEKRREEKRKKKEAKKKERRKKKKEEKKNGRKKKEKGPMIISKSEFVAGGLGGIAQVVTGHPIDTLKSRIQLSTSKLSLVAAFQDLIRNEGIFAFYKGMLSPILGVGD
jgi:hypothetical protein